MNDKIKGYIAIAIFLIVIAGISGLVNGNSFVGGVGQEADAIGDLISFFIKVGIVIGLIWLLTTLFKDKK